MRYTNFSQAVALTSGVLAVCFLMGYIVLAWTEPTQSPPEGNVPTPLNVGNVGQSKEGGLILNTGGAAMGLIVQSGKVGIGLSDVGIYKMGVGGHLYVGGNVAINGGNLNLGGNLIDSAGNIIYNDSTKKIERNRLPFNQGDIVSDWETSAWDTDYYNVANLSPENVKQGVSFGRNQTGNYEAGYAGKIVAEYNYINPDVRAISRNCGYTGCDATGIGVCEAHDVITYYIDYFGYTVMCDTTCDDNEGLKWCQDETYYEISCSDGSEPIYIYGHSVSRGRHHFLVYICTD